MGPAPGAIVGGILALVTGLLLVSSARADLMDDAAAVQDGWRLAGAAPVRVATHFLLAGEVRALEPSWGGKRDSKCLTLLAMAERPLSFTIRSAPSHPTLLPPLSRASEAGVVRVHDCGSGPLFGGLLEIAMGAARGAVEILVVSHPSTLPEVDWLLPERALGPLAAPSELAGPLALSPLGARLRRAREGAREDGARMAVVVKAQADDRGVGALALRLSAGCHRLGVLADATSAVDIDAEVRVAPDNTVLARDQSHAPDGRLDFCLGEVTQVELRFAGAGAPVAVHVLDALWPPPSGIRAEWGPRVRAGMSWALHRRRLPPPAEPPIVDLLGATGVTRVPISVEPGVCYVAAFASLRGSGGSGRLTVELGEERRHDDTHEDPAVAAVSFCAAAGDDHAVLQIDLRAAASWWVASLWQMGRTGR